MADRKKRRTNQNLVAYWNFMFEDEATSNESSSPSDSSENEEIQRLTRDKEVTTRVENLIETSCHQFPSEVITAIRYLSQQQ